MLARVCLSAPLEVSQGPRSAIFQSADFPNRNKLLRKRLATSEGKVVPMLRLLNVATADTRRRSIGDPRVATSPGPSATTTGEGDKATAARRRSPCPLRGSHSPPNRAASFFLSSFLGYRCKFWTHTHTRTASEKRKRERKTEKENPERKALTIAFPYNGGGR